MRTLEEAAGWGPSWQRDGNWAPHSASAAEAERLASAFLRIASTATGRFDWTNARGLDVGAGAGHIAAALAKRGVAMVASEHSDDGLRLLAAQNPQLESRRVNLLDFSEEAQWDLIVCREVYAFTRANDFAKQMRLVKNLAAALRPSGVLLLIGSDLSYPNCMSWRRMRTALKAVPGLRAPLPTLEAAAKRTHGRVATLAANVALEIAFAAINRVRSSKLAATRIYPIVRL